MPLGHVSRINVTPVKSFRLHHPDAVWLDRQGAVEDRRFLLVDDRGRLYNGARDGVLVRAEAAWDASSRRLKVTVPGAGTLEESVVRGSSTVVDVYGRRVRGHVVDGPWACALSDLLGRSADPCRARGRCVGHRHATGDHGLAGIARHQSTVTGGGSACCSRSTVSRPGGRNVAQPPSARRGGDAAGRRPNAALCLPVGRSRHGLPRPQRPPRTDRRTWSSRRCGVPRRLCGGARTGPRLRRRQARTWRRKPIDGVSRRPHPHQDPQTRDDAVKKPLRWRSKTFPSGGRRCPRPTGDVESVQLWANPSLADIAQVAALLADATW